MGSIDAERVEFIVKALADGRVSCRVWHGEKCIYEKILRSANDMRAPVEMSQLSKIGHLDLYPAFCQFIKSDDALAVMEGRVCRVIEKFGAALEFIEFVRIEFWKS